MRKLLVIGVTITLSGCMMPDYKRLVPENKDAHIEIVAPLYGHIIIDTRVTGSSNSLPPLLTPQNPK